MDSKKLGFVAAMTINAPSLFDYIILAVIAVGTAIALIFFGSGEDE